jgi:probable phosphoglycerate mutase
MNPIVILCRHGNTFNKGDKVVIVGAHEDLPLTDHGIEQAHAVGAALATSKIAPSRIISGPLQRTKVFAECVRSETKASSLLEIDARLIEFDYGAWSGLSNDEVIALSGQDALEAWQERSERPRSVPFVPSAEEARADAISMLHELSTLDGTFVIVTSNGRLREFGRILSPESASSAYKVRTGHACLIAREGTDWRVLGWDLGPDALKDALHRLR